MTQRPVQLVLLRWRNSRVEVIEYYEGDDLSFEWVYTLAAEDARLLRAVICEVRPLEDDVDWDGQSLFVKDIVCFHGYQDYPAYWYKLNTKQPEELAEPDAAPKAKPAKKAKKK